MAVFLISVIQSVVIDEIKIVYDIIVLHRESKKGCHPNHGYNFVNSWWICKILSLLERPVNFQQIPY